MFQFTTTNVINSNRDCTTGKPLWSVLEAKDDKPASFNVKRVNNFISTNITAIYKAEATDAEFARATFDLLLIDGLSGDSYRLDIYVGLSQASQESRYANDLLLKGKPFSVDFIWGDNAYVTALNLVKIINKYEVLVYGEKLLKVIVTLGTFLTILATNEYQRFRRINIEKFDKKAYHGMGEYRVVRSLEDLPKFDSAGQIPSVNQEAFFAGREGFGTYPFLLHNLRIPTYARTRAFGVNQDETPIAGAKYNQYTIYYCAERGVLGDNAVGDLVRSRTTHVFYVKLNLASDFENALSKVGTITTVDRGHIPDPATTTDDISTISSKVAELENALNTKLDILTAGDGITIDDNEISVELLDE